MLAVTHIDCLEKDPEQLDRQCSVVREAIQKKLQQQRKMQSDKVLPLHVFNEGNSMRVNCLLGHGIHELRQTLLQATKELPWYGEMLPAAYIELRSKVVEMMIQKSDQAGELAATDGMERGEGKRCGWITWHTYYELASNHCKLDETNIQIATKFLHETGKLE